MGNIFMSVSYNVTEEYAELSEHGYPQLPHLSLPTSATCSTFDVLSSAFLKLLTTVMDAFEEAPNSLDTLKQLLSQLVLPVHDGDVLPLVLPVAMKEFIAIRDDYAKSVLCIQEACDDEQSGCENASLSNSISPGHNKSHTLDLNTLQSPQPLIFLRLNNHEEQLSEPLHTFRLSVEVNRPFLTLKDYDNITNAVSATFLLPNLALVYAGCSKAPLVVTWLVPAQLLPYLESPSIGSTASGDRLLAEQGVVAVAIGEESRTKCLRIKVCVELM